MINYNSYAYYANHSHRILIYLLSSNTIHDELTGALPPPGSIRWSCGTFRTCARGSTYIMWRNAYMNARSRPTYVSEVCACVYPKNTISNNFRNVLLGVFLLILWYFRFIRWHIKLWRPFAAHNWQPLLGRWLEPPFIHPSILILSLYIQNILHIQLKGVRATRTHDSGALVHLKPTPRCKELPFQCRGCFQKLNKNTTHHYARQNLSYAIHRCTTSFIIPTLSTPWLNQGERNGRGK